jgi:hypothetical protein
LLLAYLTCRCYEPETVLAYKVVAVGVFANFAGADRRLAAITAKGDPLEMIARVVPFESFRAEIESAC